MQAVASESIALESRRIRLRLFQNQDREIVYAWHSDLNYLYLWTHDRDLLPYERFIRRFERSLKKRFDLFLMVEKRSSGKPLGFIYNYASDSVDRNCYICVYMDLNGAVQGAGVDAVILFLKYLFNYYGYRKVYAEVYAFNQRVVKMAEKAGFVLEGCLQGHRWWNGRFWDQHIYAMTAKVFRSHVQRFTPYLFQSKG